MARKAKPGGIDVAALAQTGHNPPRGGPGSCCVCKWAESDPYFAQTLENYRGVVGRYSVTALFRAIKKDPATGYPFGRDVLFKHLRRCMGIEGS